MRKPLLNLHELPEPEQANTDFALQGEIQEHAYLGSALKELKKLFLFQHYTTVHFVNKGYWDMHELLMMLLDLTGPAHLAFSSYAISETAARAFAALKESGQLLSITAVIDNRSDTRSAGSLQLLRGVCDRLTLCACHAKVSLLYNDYAEMTVMGSANYTENKRYEAGMISSVGDTRLFHQKWMEEAINEYGQYNP